MNPNVTVINPTITEDKESKIRVAAYCRVSTDSFFTQIGRAHV